MFLKQLLRDSQWLHKSVVRQADGMVSRGWHKGIQGLGSPQSLGLSSLILLSLPQDQLLWAVMNYTGISTRIFRGARE